MELNAGQEGHVGFLRLASQSPNHQSDLNFNALFPLSQQLHRFCLLDEQQIDELLRYGRVPVGATPRVYTCHIGLHDLPATPH